MRVAVITVLFLTALAATALAETKVREYDDRVVVEVTGSPATPEETARQKLQEQLGALEYERQRLTAEQERLQRGEDGTGNMDMRERRTAMMEKHRQLQQVEEQLRDLAQQSPAEGSSAAAAR
ncbi:hypothetical protein [Geobacter argillaceus]|uniref:Uncharacterized protein n=1 Tax=Geobacter argillaceus TaxID=345631 RepID=A0A562VFX4_9BACT|nr:hypothetical protein [Geobacter argillaceus]TWJ16694.1 hypothetical protein JN12_03266 [Geobacter argillaceus]